MTLSAECVVVGAGVIGLGIARALALAGREVVVIEAAAGIGSGISSRNSAVIHAGIYYAPHSSKARTCLAGNRLMRAFCKEKGLPLLECGKVIVARPCFRSMYTSTIVRPSSSF